MKGYVFILIALSLTSCRKECSWNYDRLHEKWVYECDPKAPEPIQYPTLIPAIYAVKNLKVEYIPMYKHAPFYKKWVEESFKNYADNIDEIRIEKKFLESNTAEVYGIPRTRVTSANHSNAGINFSAQSSYRMPSNVSMGICFDGLTMNGEISLRDGKPINGVLNYKCADELIMRYTFNF